MMEDLYDEELAVRHRWFEDTPVTVRKLVDPNYEIEELGGARMVMDQIVVDEQVLAATTADVLAGTQLAQPDVPGVYTIFAASDVADTTITVALGSRVTTDAAVVVERANSEIREDEDVFFQVLSKTGNRPVITITESTAMACRVRTIFLPAARS